MKKITLLFLLVTLFTVNAAFAQDTRFGIKGGLNVATVGGDAENVSGKLGLHIGGFAQIDINDLLKFQPELIYSMQGAKGFDVDRIKHDYINVPLILKVYPAKNGFNIQVGPQVGVLVRGKFASDDFSVDLKNQMNNIDFAIGFGLGMDLGNVLADVRYNYGLNSTASEDAAGTFPNRTLQVSLGFKL